MFFFLKRAVYKRSVGRGQGAIKGAERGPISVHGQRGVKGKNGGATYTMCGRDDPSHNI